MSQQILSGLLLHMPAIFLVCGDHCTQNAYLRLFVWSHVVRKPSPDIVILETGTNDLSSLGPEEVSSQIDDLVASLIQEFSVRVVGACLVIPRGILRTPPLSPKG